tara:strand:+ start:117 stop:677 length:561 start_codon:yes stop_codon:yes gene_type:complete
MKVIIKAVPVRKDCIEYLKNKLPDAIFCMDKKKCAMDTFLRSLEIAKDDPCIHMEEDIFITKNFMKKASAVIRQKPMSVVQFFSMRKADLTIGSRWDRSFLMNQCFYAPPFYSRLMLEFSALWIPKNIEEHPNGTDAMVRDFLKYRKERYWVHCPSLVDHREGKSVIDPRRSSKRQSFTFEDAEES